MNDDRIFMLGIEKQEGLMASAEKESCFRGFEKEVFKNILRRQTFFYGMFTDELFTTKAGMKMRSLRLSLLKTTTLHS